jgi:hypothetical protein
MIVQGTTKGPHFGPFAIGNPGEEEMHAARDLGVRVAELAQTLFG